VHHWAIKLLPVLEKAFRRNRPVGKGWRMDETYIRVNANGCIFTGPWTRTATPSTFCCAPIGTRLGPGVTLRNRSPGMARETVTIDKSGTNLAAPEDCRSGNARQDPPVKIPQ
jgi:putative transposase